MRDSPLDCGAPMASARDDEPTCGKGLAANAVLPAKFAELIAATAEVLERHTAALDATDPHAAAEREAYTTLVDAHRAIAKSLSELAQSMTSYRDLPMARHDPAIMSHRTARMRHFSSSSPSSASCRISCARSSPRTNTCLAEGACSSPNAMAASGDLVAAVNNAIARGCCASWIRSRLPSPALP